MALQLRPNCEMCDVDLPPDSADARICSYECTFCVRCVEDELRNVCPNCGGGFTIRPIRPTKEWRSGTSLTQQPASTERQSLKYDRDNIRAHRDRIAAIAPKER